MEFVPHVIDGQETESASGKRFASVDPWTREPWAEVALGGTFSREFFTEPKAVVMQV
jgi:hypothetical protein